MSFMALILKNLVRQRVRTMLTVLGISIGITTVVALGVVTAGFKATTADVIRTGGADFMVAQKGSADLTFSVVSEANWQAISQLSGVARAEGMLFHVVRMGSNPFFIAVGRRPESIQENPPLLLSGRLIDPAAPNELMLGYRAADDLHAGPGDTVTIDRRDFQVVGVYRSGSLWMDGGAFMPLRTVQEMASKPGVVTAVFVTVQEGASVREVAQRIEREFSSLTVVESVEDIGEVDQGLQVLDAANLAISVLAVGIGAIGVMNTMIMSVFERTREIGILRAVGWSGSRILRMIVGESILLCLAAAVFGTLLGVMAVQGVTFINAVRNLLEPQYTVGVFVRAVGVAVVVALVGAAYPAFRAVRLTPLEALRYE